VFVAAVVLRLVFALITSPTFDPDEFVILSLGRAVAGGAIPYRDLVFFHPPGMLALFAALQPLVTWWWPAGRLVTLLADSMTALCVWRIGKQYLNDGEALAAGLLYAASPIALISAVRVGPDPIITALGTAGLLFLLTTRAPRAGAIAAGICLALAVWTKYAALLYLPVYLVAAPQRARTLLVGWTAALLCLFAPFFGDASGLYTQTVAWQVNGRAPADFVHRLSSVGTYWLLLNPLSVLALLRTRRPTWLLLGFALGALFLLTPQAHYHYFAIVEPFAALLAAPLATSIFRRTGGWRLAACMVVLTLLWGFDIARGSGSLRLHVVAARLSDAQQVASILDRETRPSGTILADRLEYAFLAHRAPALNYFWDMNTWVNPGSLERQLPHVAAIVKTKGPSTFPSGFAEYVRRQHYPSEQTGLTFVWLIGHHGDA
jgi:hypothetical protein